jgi:hypothetical protein
MNNARGSDTLLSTLSPFFFDLLAGGNTKGEGETPFKMFSALSRCLQKPKNRKGGKTFGVWCLFSLSAVRRKKTGNTSPDKIKLF